MTTEEIAKEFIRLYGDGAEVACLQAITTGTLPPFPSGGKKCEEVPEYEHGVL
ncbi:MAG: hypothetical protein WCK54_18365 [Desulfuromonadales bacterium]